MKIKSRLAAFLIHLLISLLVLIVMLFAITVFWYPNDLIYVGGLHGLKILLFVDIMLGPILTLIIFTPQKKGLKFDLAIIACAQLACIIYGLMVISSQRPMIQILLHNGVHTLTAADVETYNININELPGSYPKKVMMSLPESRSSWSTVMITSELADNKPFKTREDLYIPLNSIEEEKYLNRINNIYEVITDSELADIDELESGNCMWVPVISDHLRSRNYACFSQENGIEKLSNKNIF